jgi:hypothetical protein
MTTYLLLTCTARCYHDISIHDCTRVLMILIIASDDQTYYMISRNVLKYCILSFCRYCIACTLCNVPCIIKYHTYHVEHISSYGHPLLQSLRSGQRCRLKARMFRHGASGQPLLGGKHSRSCGRLCGECDLVGSQGPSR